MEQLKACYEKYLTQADKVWKNRSKWDGMLGIGRSSKNHPCHTDFFEDVTSWVDTFLKGNPDRETAEAAVAYVLEMSERYKGQFTYWTMYAAHGLVRPLVSLVSPQFAAQTRTWYEAHIPRPDRLPVQKELYKLLKKREKA